ncbi:SAF domain-containing protein [Saccharopolyspora sp. NPDC003762]
MSSTGTFGITASYSPGQSGATTAGGSPRIPRRRRWWLLATSLVLVVCSVGGMLTALAIIRQRESMLVLARDIAWGQPITDTDVTTVELPPDARRYVIPDSDRARVLGHVAASNLRAGRLLSPTDVTTQAVPAAGQHVLGIRLEPGHFPARGLAPNDPVAVLALTPSADATGDTVAAGGGFRARVVQVSPPDADGAIVADLLIPADAAEQASAAAAGGALVMLLGPNH